MVNFFPKSKIEIFKIEFWDQTAMLFKIDSSGFNPNQKEWCPWGQCKLGQWCDAMMFDRFQPSIDEEESGGFVAAENTKKKLGVQ